MQTTRLPVPVTQPGGTWAVSEYRQQALVGVPASIGPGPGTVFGPSTMALPEVPPDEQWLVERLYVAHSNASALAADLGALVAVGTTDNERNHVEVVEGVRRHTFAFTPPLRLQEAQQLVVEFDHPNGVKGTTTYGRVQYVVLRR